MDNPTTLLDDIAKLAKRLNLDMVLKGRRTDVEALLAVGSIAQGGAGVPFNREDPI